MHTRQPVNAAVLAERRKCNNLSFINEGEVKEPTHYNARTPQAGRSNDDAIIDVAEFNETVTPQTPRLLLPTSPSANPSGARISSLVKSERASRVSMVLQSTAVYQRLSMAVGVQPSLDGMLSESARTPVLCDEKPSCMYSFDSNASAMDTRRHAGGAPSNILGSMRDVDTVRGMSLSMAKLHALRDLLGSITDVNGHIDRATFSHTFDIADPSAFVCSANPNQINAKALLVETCVELDIDDEEKLAFIFDSIDQDKSMYVTAAQVADLLAANFASFKLVAVGTSFKDMADTLFAKVGVADDRMTYKVFREVFGPFLATAYDEHDDGSDASFVEQHVDGHEPEIKSKILVLYERHHLRILWLLLYFQLNAIVFLFKWHQYPVDPALGYGLKVARACAQVCMLNFVIVLLPMCRSIVQVMKRSVLLWHMIPFDDHIEFHKIVGTTLLTAGLVHTGAHVSNMLHLYCLATPAQIRASIFVTHNVSMFASGTTPPFTDMVSSVPVWTGVILLVITCISFPLAAIPKFRQGKFNLFWYSHMLFFPFLLVGCLHGLAGWLATPTSFFWIAPPLALYLLERRLRYAKVFTTPLQIVRARMLDGVVALYIEKPKRFHYRPGMYLYLNVPKLSSHEWHPFTISSAPGDQYLSVHIRNSGDWTNALHDLIHRVHRGEVAYPSVFIDGPVGAPTQDYHRFKTIVMIGGGIGVTPFASILKDVVHLWDEYRCLNCQHVRHPRSFRIQKMYFHWVTRGQESLGWFQHTMNQIADMDKDNVIEVHQYLSTVKSTDKSFPQLKMIQAVVHDATGRDVVSGLINSKQMTHFGRPNWDAVFHNLTRKHRGEEVGVFFCGPHALDKVLQEMCLKYSSEPDTGGVYFDYHSEKFA
ncbi:hypothetical protein H310_00630 [Aphanomyces invadans]|uniref:FAD-binding FR-type domain-containing protein n=1 Tax=Aphanomyces invadans TaxID=157072 RepID=A0A024UVA8_9STRA|nr:hypothetical protein H310_00630 [Aphanomyces invadans]ETW10289.1 hypothetical protein H310_00630 [Aphanomyces invadans]|eukprot:XP_008861700.1 hypothetical protein H310_00630 [Aphanomyces invadans]